MSKADRPARPHGLIFYIVALVMAEFIILMAASVRGVIGMAIAIAGGVGYWFLIRRFWRRLASDSPESGFVRGGLRMSSRTRKVISGAICAFLLLMNIGVASYDPSTAAKDNSPTEETEQSEGEAVPSGDGISTDSSTDTGVSASETASPDDGSISQGGSDDLTDSGESISESQTDVGSSSEVDTTSDDALPEDYKALRMRDDVTDEFVRSFDSVADISLSEFSNGNHRGKVYAHCYGYSAVQSGYYFEILDTSAGKISVTVEVGGSTGDDNGKGSSGMRDVFRDVVKAIDPSVSDDEIYSYFDADPTGTDGDKIGGVEVFISREAELSGGHYYGYIRVTKL